MFLFDNEISSLPPRWFILYSKGGKLIGVGKEDWMKWDTSLASRFFLLDVPFSIENSSTTSGFIHGYVGVWILEVFFGGHIKTVAKNIEFAWYRMSCTFVNWMFLLLMNIDDDLVAL